MRKILHIDMDAFYASVEQRDNPELRGKPIAVGHGAQRGVVAAASYEARKFGVRSAMPSVTAQRCCPHLIFVPPRFEHYREVSRQIHQVFRQYSTIIEPLSLDEAYLDITDDIAGLGSATATAEAIRADILRVTGLTASAGISYNKFLAKIASDENKPNGQCVIRPEQGADFVAALPVKKFHGVGPRTNERLAQMGIQTGLELRQQSREFLQHHFGKFANYLYDACRGIDERPVRANRERKSIGAERTFSKDLFNENELMTGIQPIIDKVWQRLQTHSKHGKTVTLKIKYSDFTQITRAVSTAQPICTQQQLIQALQQLLQQRPSNPLGIRLLGASVSNFTSKPENDADTNAQYHWQF